MSLPKRPLLGVLAIAGMSALLLSSCTPGSPEPETPGGTTEGVAFGATKDEWIAAFEDVDPIEIRAQTPAPAGSFGSISWENYYAAIEEYSGGKITFDIGFAYSYAGPADADEAVEDGTLDLAPLLPTLDPAKFPSFTAMSNLTYLTSQAPTQALVHSNTYQLQAGWETQEIVDEFTADGLTVIWMANSLPPTGLLCNQEITSLADAQGLQSQASSPAAGQQMEAFGITPVALPYTEVFESIQRGVIQCTNVFPGQAALFGVPEVANYIHFARDAGLVHTPGNVVMNTDFWESLPLVAQQLIFDQQRVFWEWTARAAWQAQIDAVEMAEANGGGVFELPQDVQDQMIDVANVELRQATLDSTTTDGAALAEKMEDYSAYWLDKIEEFGFPADVELSEMADWLESGDPDFDGLIDLMFEEIILEHRPA